MPFEQDAKLEGLGLALSGGGFRATLFHVGSLRRLVELEILGKLTRISSVSGGSIAAGRLAQVWADLSATMTVDAFERLVAEPLKAFCRLAIDANAIGKGVLSPFESPIDIVEKQYAKHLMSKRLDELPSHPVFVFNSTNLQTGRSFRFTKKYMGDYRLGLIRDPRLPVAKAVAASSGFPPFLSPVKLSRPGSFEKTAGADLHGKSDFADKIYLSDGGVYDNLGLETVWNRCETVLVSDAGAPFSIDAKPSGEWVKQTLRALDVATDQSRALRKRALVADFSAGQRSGAYWGIDTDIAEYKLADALQCNPVKIARLAAIRTRLDPFSDQEQGELMNWGYAVTDAAIRRFAPQLVKQGQRAQWPAPEWALT